MRSWSDYKQTMIQPDTLCLAAKEGDIERIALLVQRGDAINAPDHRGYSPLMLACYADHENTAKYLIACRADVDTADPAGNTVLMGMCFKGYEALARLLIDKGASVHIRNHAGLDAYDVATTFGRKAIAQLLVSHGVSARRTHRIVTFLKLVGQRFFSHRPRRNGQ